MFYQILLKFKIADKGLWTCSNFLLGLLQGINELLFVSTWYSDWHKVNAVKVFIYEINKASVYKTRQLHEFRNS